jgi:phosphohistidine phosphatase
MPRRLLLIRHAKAVQGGPSDAQRELAPRGLRDAAAAGRWLADNDFTPEYVVVSPAVRAAQTWQAVAVTLGADSVVEVDSRIYDNTLESLLCVVHDVVNDHSTIALVGHNPSMHALAAALDDGLGDADAHRKLAESYPTMGIAVFDVDASWADLGVGGATLREFLAPRN